MASPDNTPTLTVRDVIIIACVCAVIIITLLIILICFICKRRRANTKEYPSAGNQPTANGGVPGMKPQVQQTHQGSYDNQGMELHDALDPGGLTSAAGSLPLSPSRLPWQRSHANPTNSYSNGRQLGLPGNAPPSYWNFNPPGHYGNRNDNSFDSQERQMYENEVNRHNDMMLYGQADGYRGQHESISMHGRPQSPNKGKFIDLEDRKDPSLQSQESGYSTGDPNKPKKVIYEVVV